MNVSNRNRLNLLAATLILAAGCSSDDPKNPTAPPATPVDPIAQAIYSVTVVPSKATLEVGSTDASILTVRANRTDTGAAPPNLTKLDLTATIGSFGAVGGPNVLTAEFQGGIVSVPFFGGATIGTATIRAQVTGSGVSGSSVGFGTVRIVEAGTPPTFFVSSVSPNTGSPQGGDRVDVLGGGFDPPIRVLFGSSTATVISSDSDSIRVEVPPLPNGLPAGQTQPVSVTVTINLNEEGQDSDTIASGFTYVNGGDPGILQPTIFSLAPASGPNEGGTQVVINGDGFEAPVQVKFGDGSTDANFNGTEAQILSVSRTRIVVLSPRTLVEGSSGAPLPNDLSDVLVKNLNTGRFTVATSAFKYGNEVIITSIGPGEGPATGNTPVTLFGQGFDEPVAVSLANVAQQVLSVSGTEINVLTVPVTITGCADRSGPSAVTNIESGDSATGPNFTYRALKPIITGVSPGSGPQAGNTNVTISGQSFAAPVVVEFVIGGESFSASVTSVNSTTILVKSPGVPNSVFGTEACDAGGGTAGTRYIATSATIKVTSPITSCTDDFSNAFLYTPTVATCVATP